MDIGLTGTSSAGAHSNSEGRSKRQRVEDDGSMHRQSSPLIDDNDDSDDFDESDSDGELTPAERASRKRKLKAMRKEEKEQRDRNSMLSTMANSHATPKAATALARALQEYVKMLLGVYRKQRSPNPSSSEPSLPEPPTVDEVHAWATQKDAAQKAMLSAPLKPVRFVSRLSLTVGSRYDHRWGSQCEAALAMAGFTRCTFDWNGRPDSAWNTAMTRIILQEWEKCHEAHGTKAFGIIAAENTSANRLEIVRRWCENQAPKFRDQAKMNVMSQTPEGKVQAAQLREMSRTRDRRRRAKTKIHTARQELAQHIFGVNSPEYLLLSHSEVHSEDKVTMTNGSGTRTKTRLEWRSGALDTFVNLVDKAIPGQEIIPRKKARAQAIVDCGAYSSESDLDAFPPQGLQESLVSNAWLDKMSGVAISNLRLGKAEVVDIRKSIQVLTNLMLPRGAAGLGEGSSSTQVPGEGSSSSSGPMMTQ
ncbi:uncharacterized protein MELLADRAFT_94912 [Melampsora larici-populina 98AG31]|uniref:Uncharacterized protein n=1 Tax=Melampsora larici-populina (strain 98AG31 / pathotype 3-4-7) TaxID=747676 RepID=F4S8E0_MELLP|nr:uncharacterized protein MELLADRAFT_94912 [Melampsora larici-populina 98AG31]EGF99107.1 hypothetical protein MELLADRAFT_94912 [Melampsora larici-populina 98AG31]